MDLDPSELARQLGKLGGLKKSRKKALAAKVNGKKGGRPKGAKDKQPRKPREKN